MQSKYVSESETVMTEMVFPYDTNQLNNLMGGKLLYYMDVVSAITAQRHCDSVAVTASVDNVSFKQPIPLGSIITLRAKVTRTFTTSMEIYVEVVLDNIPHSRGVVTNQAYYTFVAWNKEEGKPFPVPQVIPQTETEKKQYEGALQRRELRLFLAGKRKGSECLTLKEMLS